MGSRGTTSDARWLGPPQADARRVVVTGLGAITSLGPNAPATWERLLAGEHGMRVGPNLDPARHACLVRGDVDDATLPERYMSALGPKVIRNTSRFARFAVEAGGEALSDAGLIDEDGTAVPAARAALDLGGAVFGTCVGGTHDDFLAAYETFKERGPSRIPTHLHVMFPHNLAAYNVQHRFGMRGPSLSIVTACATGAQAIGEGFRAVKYGDAPIMLAGAIESTQHPFFVAGFEAMRAVVTDSNDDPGAASRPFDASRAGFVLGEGCGIVVLEERQRALARGARIYAEVLGFGSSNDAFHPIAPQPEGLGASRAIRAALSDGGVPPDLIGHVNAHAASTPAGDLAEANAIRSVFGARAAALPVTSIKGAIGHCMGAAGAIETISAILTLATGQAPPTRNYRTPDPEIGLDVVHGAPRAIDVAAVTKHSFGLGGQNACLVLGRAGL
jgi:3-oxoacyl-[acyl-carrier-protein] synthase II